MIKRRLLVSGLWFFWLLVPLSMLGLDPHTPMAKYLFHSWTTRDGLPQNTIHTMVQDTLGFIWLGTENGLVRFDGSYFKTYTRENTPVLTHNAILALAIAKDGTLWIGTHGGGIVTLKANVFQKFSASATLPSPFIRVILPETSGSPWFGSSGAGLFRFSNGSLIIFDTFRGLSSNQITALCQDSRKRLWIGTDNGLNCLEKGKLQIYPPLSFFAQQKITALFEDSFGFLWVGTQEGAYRFHVRRLGNESPNRNTPLVPESYNTSQGLAGNEIRAILEDRHHNIWLATHRGLHRLTFEPNPQNTPPKPRLDHFTSDETLAGNSLLSLLEDHLGNLWMGTVSSGLQVLREGKFSFFTEKDGLANNYIKTVFQDHQGSLWIGTNGGGLNQKKSFTHLTDTSGFITYTRQDGLSSNTIQALTQDPLDSLWIGTDNGLNRFKDGVFQVFGPEQGLTHPHITSLLAEKNQKLWIGTFGGGLYLYAAQKFQNYTTTQGLPDNFILALAQDPYQNLWIATNRGVSCFDGQLFRHFSDAPGVPQGMVTDIYCDAEGTLWLATQNQGLFRYQYGRFTRFDLGPRLSNSPIFRILEDNRENLWLSSASGIFSLSRRHLNALARKNPAAPITASSEGFQAFIKAQYFQEEDGLQTAVCSGGSQPAGWKTKDGTIFFPTIQGLAAMNLGKTMFSITAKPQPNQDTPLPLPTGVSYITILREEPVFIEKILVSGSPIALRNHFKLPASTEAIEFQFTAINYRTPGKTLYKYRLAGYDKSWQVTRASSAIYSHLPAGEYEFKVYARNSDGNWSYEGDSYTFTVADSFFRSIWFYLLLAIAITLAIFIAQHLFKTEDPLQEIPEEKYKGSSLTQSRSKELLNQLLKIMNTEKPFLDPELTLQKLAQRLAISKEDLSQVINEQLAMNFKNFLNKHRIDEAKKRLLDPKESQFVLLKIAFDVGFNSKSAFNASFKKVTGLSPSEYRKKHGA